MEAFDEEDSDDDAGDEEDNMLMSLIGLIILTLGLTGGVSSGFLGGGAFGIGNYISWILSAFAYVLNFWGWWKYVDSTVVTDERTTYRSYRVNMLAALVICFISLWNFAAGFIWYSKSTTVWGTAGGSLALAAVGGYFVWEYVQNLWWNNDSDGSMADDTKWSWFDTELDAEDYVDVFDEAVDDMYE
jgi:O-antigen/teichoic acid export membrane protein